MISLVSQSCLTLCKPTDCSLPGSSVHGDSPWQEHWSGLPCPPPGDLLNPGTEPRFHPLQVDSLLFEPPGNPRNTGVCGLSLLQAIFPTQELSPSLLHWASLYSVYFSYLWTISSLFLLSLFYEPYLVLLSVPLILLDLTIFSSSFSHPSWYTPPAFYSFFLGFCHLCTQFCEPWIYSLSPSHAHKFQIKISDSLWRHLFEIPLGNIELYLYHQIASHQLTTFSYWFSSARSLSCVRLFVTPWTAAHQASLSITNSWRLLKLMSIESVMPSKHLILCHPLILLPSIFPSIGVFSNESVLHIRWSEYWSFSFSTSLSNEYSALISFKIDWFDLLAVQEMPKGLLQHHKSINSLVLNFLYSPTFTSIHDYRKNHSFD